MDPSGAAVENILGEMRENNANKGRIFGTLGTDSMYGEENASGKPTRRQFPDKSAMARINQSDNAPGSQADGGTGNVSKRQFPKKSAMKPINRAPLSSQPQDTSASPAGGMFGGKRMVKPEEDRRTDDAPMKTLLSDVYISGFGNQPAQGAARAGRRASRDGGVRGASSQAPFAVDPEEAGPSSAGDYDDDGGGYSEQPAGGAQQHGGVAPWMKDSASGIGHNPRRRNLVHLQSDARTNGKARAIKGLPKHIAGKGANKGANGRGPPSPLSQFMSEQGHGGM